MSEDIISTAIDECCSHYPDGHPERTQLVEEIAEFENGDKAIHYIVRAIINHVNALERK